MSTTGMVDIAASGMSLKRLAIGRLFYTPAVMAHAFFKLVDFMLCKDSIQYE